MLRGKVYFVGAGPGNIELITLKGYRLICQADVILHDHLIPTELLNLVKPTAEVISVAKFAGRHTMLQSQINKLLLEKVTKLSSNLREVIPSSLVGAVRKPKPALMRE